MEEHFILNSSNCLIAHGKELDLHNFYNFVGLDYSIINRVLILRWLRKPQFENTKGLASEVKLVYQGVVHFEFRPRDPEMPFTEDDCLWSAGYWRAAGHPSDILFYADSGVFCSKAKPEEDWFRAFEFHSGAVVIVKAKEAHAEFIF